MLPKDAQSALLLKYHTVIYDSCFSPCGKYLAAGSKFGDVAIFSLTSCLSPNASDESRNPLYSFKAFKNGGVYSLISSNILLICAGEGGVQAYKWADLTAKSSKQCWSLQIPQKVVFSHPEVNCCAVAETESSNILYAGGGDNLVHSWDLESGAYLEGLSGHNDYIHSLQLFGDNTSLASVSEDGTARIWDLRTKKTAHIIKPYDNEVCARPDMGKWLQSLAVDKDGMWLLLGGGPTLSSWHLNTLTPAATFDTPGVAQNVALFHEDGVISAGTANCLNHWTLTGHHRMAVPVSPSSVFSVGVNYNSRTCKVLIAAGSSSEIDVCTHFGYRAFSLSFQPALS